MPSGTLVRSNAAVGYAKGLPNGAGRFWAATASLLLGVAQGYAVVGAPCLAPKSLRPNVYFIMSQTLIPPPHFSWNFLGAGRI